MFREAIERAVREALTGMGVEEATFVVERPSHMEHGDYSTNAALTAKVDANALAGKLHIDGVERVEVVGRFINFFLSPETIRTEIQNQKLEQIHAGKKIMVEYTDPNPFKEFHIGHLMSNAIGESIARLLEYSGAKVLRANYQGDVGPHVAKAIWGKMQKPEINWGQAYVYGSEQYENHKEEIDALNKKIYEKSDAEVNKLYDEGRELSLQHFEELYRKLDTKFDFYFFESDTAPIGLTLVKKHSEVFETSDGAIVFKAEKYGLHTRVFVNSLGLPTYEAKELGLIDAKKQKGNFDLSLTITANETNEYFKVVRKAAEMIFPDLEGKMVVRFHGMLRLTTGKMSSRTGNVITGESLLEDLQKAARGRMDVAVGAVKYAVLKQGSGKDITFDPEKSLSLEGDSGPYLQYARVRALSLLRKASDAQEVDHMKVEHNEDFKEFGLMFRLMKVLIHFPNIVARAASDMEPHYVTTYLTELASTFNSWYGTERIIVDGQIGKGVPSIIKAFENTMAQGLHVLGIPAPEEM